MSNRKNWPVILMILLLPLLLAALVLLVGLERQVLNPADFQTPLWAPKETSLLLVWQILT